MKHIDEATLQKAAEWIRSEMSKRRVPGEHPSHKLTKIAEEAEQRFDLGTFGVEGWCDTVGNSGVSYLNTGDTYAPTIVMRTSRLTWAVHVAMGGWGSYVR